MSDLDTIINMAVNEAELWSGRPVELVMAQSKSLGPTVCKRGKVTMQSRWSADEVAFVRENVGYLSYEEIAQRLGRSLNAVHVCMVRRGIRGASKTAGWLTAHQVAMLLSLDTHTPSKWIEYGIMPGERMQFADREIRRVKISDFKKWLVQPTSWVYFKMERIRNASLRHLVELAQERWGDEWWTCRQVADYHHCDTRTISASIYRGKLQGFQAKFLCGRYHNPRWSFWFIKRSDAMALKIVTGKGHGHELGIWTDRADAFIIKAKTQGLAYADIARMMKWDAGTVWYRWNVLKKRNPHQLPQNPKTDFRGDPEGLLIKTIIGSEKQV